MCVPSNVLDMELMAELISFQGPDDSSSTGSPGQKQPTPYEFIQAWSTLRPSMGPEPYAKLMEQIEPDDLPKGMLSINRSHVIFKIGVC